MSARHSARGRNHWHHDGRPAGFGMPLVDGEPRHTATILPMESADDLPPWRTIAIRAVLFAGSALFLLWCGTI